MSIANRLKLVRGQMSQDEFAQRLCVHKSSLGRYERGETLPDANVLASVCFEFGICAEWLLLGKGPMQSGKVPGENVEQPDGQVDEDYAHGALAYELDEMVEKAEIRFQRQLRASEKAAERERDAMLKSLAAKDESLRSKDETIRSKDELLSLYKSISQSAPASMRVQEGRVSGFVPGTGNFKSDTLAREASDTAFAPGGVFDD